MGANQHVYRVAPHIFSDGRVDIKSEGRRASFAETMRGNSAYVLICPKVNVILHFQPSTPHDTGPNRKQPCARVWWRSFRPSKFRVLDFGMPLNFRTTASQKRETAQRRARIEGSWTCASLCSRLESNKEDEEEEDLITV